MTLLEDIRAGGARRHRALAFAYEKLQGQDLLNVYHAAARSRMEHPYDLNLLSLIYGKLQQAEGIGETNQPNLMGSEDYKSNLMGSEDYKYIAGGEPKITTEGGKGTIHYKPSDEEIKKRLEFSDKKGTQITGETGKDKENEEKKGGGWVVPILLLLALGTSALIGKTTKR